MSTWLVTGASRGIGLEFVHQLLERGDTVYAAVRSPESTKIDVPKCEGKLHVIRLDVSDSASISAAAQTVRESLQGRPLDYLINNAGIAPSLDDIPSKIKPEMLLKMLKTNVIGPTTVFQEFLPMLDKSAKPVVINITSDLASISSTAAAAPASYSISKAALNMLTVKQAKERPDIIFLAMDPGWVKTDMGGSNASLDARTSVRGQIQVITNALLENSGVFKRYDGTDMPW